MSEVNFTPNSTDWPSPLSMVPGVVVLFQRLNVVVPGATGLIVIASIGVSSAFTDFCETGLR
jgi:hypothetical protein